MDVAGHDVSLFHVVDAGDLEATVLRQAENRARDATIPRFVPSKGLGFGAASLGNFCSTTDALVLRLVADSARQEGRQLANPNLVARDKVQMKEQILKGLLLQRKDEEDGNAMDGLGIGGDVRVATMSHAGGAAGVDADVDAASRCDGELQRREELIKSGAITPLDDLTGAPTTLAPTRSRMTLMDHKIAEGMTVKLPRSRRRPSRSSISQRGLASAEPGSEVLLTDKTANTTVQCPICTQNVRVDQPCNPDEILSKHMDRCSRRSGRKRRDKQNRVSSQAEMNDKPRAGEECASFQRPRRSVASADTEVHTTMDPPNGTSSTYSNRATSAKRRRAGGREGTREGTRVDTATSVNDTDGSLKVLAGSQLLVDDFDDEDFEARKVQAEGVVSVNRVGEERASAADISELGDGLTMDSGVADRLFQFQLTGVRWMWQLHRQGAGGIVGDEMGLGKTVQVSAYLGALHGSNAMRRALVLCPATVLSHWMTELHAWAPQLRVVILHRCFQAFNAIGSSSGKLRALVRQILGWPNIVVVTSYEGLKSLKALLLPCNWDYCILDEGQRIRNPDAQVTLVCKQIRTVHRLVLTGTPIQNNLRELWSLFDFVFPGRLGTLPAFEAEFANPIRVGGYANASPMQARLAYRCALVLRDLIHPYLLRRQKKDLEDIISLPAKTEQVLFCRLTSYQRRLYGEFLESAEVKSVLNRTMRAFRAIGILRKLCNHPDLACRVGDSVVTRISSQRLWGNTSDTSESEAEDIANETKDTEEGAVQRSGKLLVLQQILPLWHKQGHRVLIFSQTRQMLNYIERFVKNMGWSYGRLDGSTPVGTRQNLIDRFNSDESIFVMLLTTRTGGVGINLTGADRVILFDPDWNPSTDMQARERSWRVGQLRQVTIYRLITAGTIEEKIYHRQIFKTALTNRVLQDPKQRRIFSAHELGDLFTLGADGSLDGCTDTVDLFQGEGKIDAPNGQRASSRRHEGGSSGNQGKRARKKAGKSGRTKNTHAAAESSTSPSPLLGTATVTLEPEPGHDAGIDRTEGNQDGVTPTGDDSVVLQALYDAAPLSSVFHHDLAEGSRVSSVEQKRMEEIAKRAAQRAVNQLRMSRHTLRAGAGQGGFQSSWTGRNGGVSSDTSSHAMPGDRARLDSTKTQPRRFGTVSNPSIAHENGAFPGHEAASSGQESLNRERRVENARGSCTGVTSQEILRQIRQRNGGQAAPSAGLFPEFQESGASEDNGKDEFYSALLQRLQDFLAQAPSGVDTAALIHAFGDVPPGDVPVFRQLLRAAAVCNNGEWTLRDAHSG